MGSADKKLLLCLLLAVVAFAIVGFIFYRLAVGTDMRVVQWFREGVAADKIAAESPKEQQYGLVAIISWGISSTCLIAGSILALKRKRGQQRGAA